MIYNLYVKKSNRNDLVFIVSAKSFNQAYKRLAYLSQYTKFRQNQTFKIQQTKEILSLKGKFNKGGSTTFKCIYIKK